MEFSACGPHGSFQSLGFKVSKSEQGVLSQQTHCIQWQEKNFKSKSIWKSNTSKHWGIIANTQPCSKNQKQDQVMDSRSWAGRRVEIEKKLRNDAELQLSHLVLLDNSSRRVSVAPPGEPVGGHGQAGEAAQDHQAHDCRAPPHFGAQIILPSLVIYF